MTIPPATVANIWPFSQCARRNLKCVYPQASRRGMRPRLLYDKAALSVPPIPVVIS